MNTSQNTLRMVLASFFLFFLGCSETPEIKRQKLSKILDEDLKFIVAEIQKESGRKNLLDSAYYIVSDYKEFQGDTAKVYAGYALVDFFYFKNAKIKQARKYRYNTKKRYWDRYYKKLQHY